MGPGGGKPEDKYAEVRLRVPWRRRVRMVLAGVIAVGAVVAVARRGTWTD
jgi:hypothetical protein